MAKPKLSSAQEYLIEELIQSSFGAQFLYTPKLFKRGQSLNEPCDLMWFGNGILVLFYLTTGNQALAKQDQHNLKQIRRWKSYWDKNQHLPLVGTNRYGDELSIKKTDAINVINISVVGHDIGIVFHPSNTLNKNELTCSIPEKLFHEIASFHGTVIDLLGIIFTYSLGFQRHLLKHTAAASHKLKSIIDRRKKEIQAAVTRNTSPEENKEDLLFIHGIIEKSRLSDPFGNAIKGGTGNPREKMAKYFSDLSAKDYAVIALAAKEAIKKTDKGKISVTAATNGLHTNWVVFATNFGINNFNEVLEKSRASLEEGRISNLPQIIYGHPPDLFDYRTPIMYVFPRERISSQASDLYQLIMQRVNFVFSCRENGGNSAKSASAANER